MFLKSVYMCLWYDMCVYIYLFTYIYTHIYHVLWACACVYMYDCRWQKSVLAIFLNQSLLSVCLKHLLLSVLLPAHMCIHACLVPIKARRGQGGGSLGTGVAGGYEPPYWVLGIEPHWKSISFSPLLFCFCFFLLNCSFSPPFFFLINWFYFNFCTIYFVHIPCPL